MATNAALLAWFGAARAAGVPLLAVSTSDQPDTERSIRSALKKDVPVLRWTCLDGFLPLNEEGEEELGKIIPQGMDPAAASARLDDALVLARKLSDGAVILAWNVHLMLEDPRVRQGFMSLRDMFKQNGRMFVALGSSFQLPPEIAGDFLTFDVPLPTPEELRAVLVEQYDAASEAWTKLPKLGAELSERVVAAVQGLPVFTAEQLIATSFIPNERLDPDKVWVGKETKVRDKKGLSLVRPVVTLKDVGGSEAWKNYMLALVKRFKPTIIVLMDEVEKAFAGMGGDLSGTTQAGAGRFCTYMSGPGGKNIRGSLSFGPAGGGKTIVSEALAGEFGLPFLVVNLDDTKGSLVGESGANMNELLKVMDAMSNGRPLIIATCNKASPTILPAEIRRRLSVHGEWFFDLPGPDDRANIWKIHKRKNGLDAALPTPSDEGWTGAEIAVCCIRAADTGLSLLEAGATVIPQSVSMAETNKQLRQDAVGRFLDAQKGGYFRGVATVANTGEGRRTFNAGNN
jgi:hypothetical protein